MKQFLFSVLFCVSSICYSQSVLQSVNSGSLITTQTSVSIGEIVITPTQNQSSSGLIGILTQVNQQQLEVSQFEISENIVVYPNPTIATIYFKTSENLLNENVSIYNTTGQLVLESKIENNNSLDLNKLSSGIYLIQFSNKKFNSFKIIKR
ncbi:T9SS type A sorting domain-containing protein [Flavobacterium sp.]|jgi:hypothetical protein|uniref:T9SS type A sorting domain-containing protein n=1 Tax=Flavobacterium sp. TaxID=239 RepID=UPI0037C1369A